MASGKGISRAFSIDSILSNGKEKLLQCQTESSFLQRDSGLPPMATRGLPLFTDTDFGFKAAQARCNVPQRYPTVGSAHVPLLGYESQQQQQQQAPFATRYLSPPGSLLSPSWKPDLDAIYQNVYLETLLQDHRAYNNPWTAFLSTIPFHKRKGGQVRFTNDQTVELEKKFATQKYLSPSDRKKVAKKLQLSERQVKTWFQNRRAKWRRLRQDSKQLGSSQLEREKREVKPLHSSHKDSNSSHTPTEKPPYNHELPPTATSDITVQSNSAYDDNMDSESVSSESESSDIEVV